VWGGPSSGIGRLSEGCLGRQAHPRVARRILVHPVHLTARDWPDVHSLQQAATNRSPCLAIPCMPLYKRPHRRT
jgi:hypothetical protein